MFTTERNTLVLDGKEKLQKISSIRDRHVNCFEEYKGIVENSSYRLMSESKNSSLYGMFMSDENLAKYFWDKGLKTTKNEKQKDFLYYFNNQNQLLLSERYDGNGGKLLRWNFFYYYDNRTEIIEYSPEDQLIYDVALIEYKNGELYSFLRSSNISQEINGYFEYLFNSIPNRVIKKTYGRYTESISELAKLH